MKLTEIIKYISEHSSSGFFYTPPIYASAKSYFFSNPRKEIELNTNDDLKRSFDQINNFCENGLTAFGYINYELGYLLEEKLKRLLPENNDIPLLHFLFCDIDSIATIKSSEIDYTEIETHVGRKIINDFLLNTSKEKYIENIGRIKEYISLGDTYQVNYTIKSKFNLSSSILDLFAQLIFSQSARYIALINFGDKIILSSSPELFFELNNDKIKVKPMKGTIKRGSNSFKDEEKRNELLSSEKDQAENIMIVDLLRNDIGKICDYGSVEAINKYNIEKYESVYQLTSDIKGKLKTNNISDVILNLFPSGSITGAPKLRTMEIIKELEKESRGVYTGLIGMFSKNHSVANVAIRTLELDQKSKTGVLGIGSGIVWDSKPEQEYDEVLLKSKFLIEPMQYFELIESMLFENGKLFLLDYHLARLRKSADYFLFQYKHDNILDELEKCTSVLDKYKSYKIRLTLAKWGRVSISLKEINGNTRNINVILSDNRIDIKNRFQYFKTTNRNVYDVELKKYSNNGFSDVIYLNEKGNVAEGARTNILIKTGENLITPPVEEGILDGCYRQMLVDQSLISEKSITLEQLINSEKVILINSVRKELVVDNIYNSEGQLLKKFN